MLIKSKIINNFNSYEVLIENGCLEKSGVLIKKKISPSRVFVLTNPKVYKLYFEKLKKSISKQEWKVSLILIPEGERFKSFESYQKVIVKLVQEKADRNSLLIALGGGVISDLAGTVAATYMRGISLIHIPTTLLAQTDASIGGKTAVNLTQAKNLVGCFYPAKLVLSDPLVLKTLDEKNFLNGLVEIIKIGLVSNKKIYEFGQKNYRQILQRDDSYLQQLISLAAKEKVRITNLDPFDRGLRKILNFGHTFGHTLETYKNYKKISHGEAVSLGILVALKLSCDLKLISEDLLSEVKDLFSKIGLPTQIKSVNLGKIWGIMNLDKKVQNRKVNFVLIKDIGKPKLQPVAEKSFYKAAKIIL